MANRYALVLVSSSVLIPRMNACKGWGKFVVLQPLVYFLFAYINWHGFDVVCFVQLIYEKLPSDISNRHVLLLDPILGTGQLFCDTSAYSLNFTFILPACSLKFMISCLGHVRVFQITHKHASNHSKLIWMVCKLLLSFKSVKPNLKMILNYQMPI